MKKILLAVSIVSMISTSLMATDGTIVSILSKFDGTVSVGIINDADGLTINKPIVGTPESVKSMLAIALTAKSTNSPVTVYSGTVTEGTGWKSITIK